MKKILTFLLFLLPPSLCAQIVKPIGINISGSVDWSNELAFTDAFKNSRRWIVMDVSGPGNWQAVRPVPNMDSNGYPLEVPFMIDTLPLPQYVRTFFTCGQLNGDSTLRSGYYRLKVTGEGVVRLEGGGVNLLLNCPIDTLIYIYAGTLPTNRDISLRLDIMESKWYDHIRDIKFIRPPYINTYQTKTFTDEFLCFLKDFQTIRFMDFTATNGSSSINWSTRAKKTFYSQSGFDTISQGGAWEYAIELCNKARRDLWLNVPHRASDDYITQLATLVNNTLDTSLKVYVEYSNETWNGIFAQYGYCSTMGSTLPNTASDSPWIKSWKYTAKRSADIFRIFNSRFSNPNRVVKVLASWAANSAACDSLLTYFNNPLYNTTNQTADALAIAPYFGGDVVYQMVVDGVENTATVSDIITRTQQSLQLSKIWIQNDKIVATNHNVALLSYEAGQHLVGYDEITRNNVGLTNKLFAVNSSPQMKQMYCEYMDFWYNNVGNLLCHYNSHGFNSKYGSWGIKEYMLDTMSNKYLALKECVFSANPKDLSGNIYNDSNGMVDNFIYGRPFNQINSQNLYVTLVKNGNFFAKVPVRADGTYLFRAVPSGTYQVVLSWGSGASQSVTPSLPPDWVNTGEFMGNTVGSDGLSNGILDVNMPTNTACFDATTQVNFGLEKRPESFNTLNFINQAPVISQFLPIDQPPFIGRDLEDRPSPGSWVNRLVKINSLPTLGFELRYNNVQVTPGQVINNYTPNLLRIAPTATTPNGTNLTTFTYTVIDKAGYEDTSASVATVQYRIGLPINIQYFSGTIDKNCNARLLWHVNGQDTVLTQYEIEASTNGINYNIIGNVNAGTASGNYNFATDVSNYNVSKLYMRLKFVNRSGTYEYTEPLYLNKSCNEIVTPSVAPTLFTDYILVKDAAQGVGELYDVSGKLLRRYQINTNFERLELANLPGGTYLLTITVNGKINSFKLRK